MIKDQIEYEGREVDTFSALNNVAERGSNDKHSLGSTPHEYEIADICFGKGRTGEISHYKKLTDLRNSYIKNLRDVQDGKSSKEDIGEKQMLLEKEFKEEVEKLREKESNEDKADDDDGEPDVKYAFIVFRDMCGMEAVKNAYNVGRFEYWSKMSCFGSLCCKED